MIRGIIFDKDGTLFDFRKTWETWAQNLIARVTDGDAAAAQSIGSRIGFDVQTGRFDPGSVVIAGTPSEIAQALAPVLPDFPDLVDVLNDEAAVAPQSPAVPLMELLRGLKERGLRLGVATNDGIDPARAHLAAAGVEASFDFIAGYDSGYGFKPGPGQLRAFCLETGLEPRSVVMVGDSLHDLKAGQAAGMRTIGVLTGLASGTELSQLATAVLPDIGHLPGWLDRQAR